jgi:NAD(P)-dependent dehydrogenase (short-subunit alcohol dehydrogenase family)
MEVLMLLKLKTAVVYGAAGSVGAAVARAFAREGAAVFLAGRRLARAQADLVDSRSQLTLLGRLPILTEVGNVAAMMASDHASPLTATAVNLNCGEIAD